MFYLAQIEVLTLNIGKNTIVDTNQTQYFHQPREQPCFLLK